MAVSDQLTKLAARAKEAEDRAAAAQGKGRADLERDVENARTSAQEQADKLRATADAKKGKLSVWWHDVQRSWDEHIEKIQPYVEMGFRHLVFHAPGPDQERFLRVYSEQVLPKLRRRFD